MKRLFSLIWLFLVVSFGCLMFMSPPYGIIRRSDLEIDRAKKMGADVCAPDLYEVALRLNKKAKAQAQIEPLYSKELAEESIRYAKKAEIEAGLYKGCIQRNRE